MKCYVVLDIETTGTHPMRNDIIEIGAIYVKDNQPIKHFKELVRPKEMINEYITNLTGIHYEMVKHAPTLDKVMPDFLEFCEDVPLIGHNIIGFDYRMLKAKATGLGYTFDKEGLDTLVISRKLLSDLPSRKLGALCKHYQISLEHAHRAYDDAYATYELFVRLKKDFEEQEPALFMPEPFVWEVPKWEPITMKQKIYLTSLCQKYHIAVPKNLQSLSKSEASHTIDKIILHHGKK